MHKLAKQFAEYCEGNFSLKDSSTYSYGSLPVCLIDCVYSLRTKYYAVTVPVVERYAEAFLNADVNTPGDTVSVFLQRIDNTGGPERFAETVLKNRQKIGGKNQIPKEQVLYQLAKYLQLLHIETLEDFRQFPSSELLEIVIRGVKGMGDAGVNYLFMLAGDPDRCKPDVHIHHCIRDACGCDISNEDCQILFTDAVRILEKKYPELTVRALDGIVWRAYQAG